MCILRGSVMDVRRFRNRADTHRKGLYLSSLALLFGLVACLAPSEHLTTNYVLEPVIALSILDGVLQFFSPLLRHANGSLRNHTKQCRYPHAAVPRHLSGQRHFRQIEASILGLRRGICLSVCLNPTNPKAL